MSPAMADLSSPVAIRVLGADEAMQRRDELASTLVDAVAHGASVNFLEGLGSERAAQFWDSIVPSLTAGAAELIVAEANGSIVGTVLLFLAQQPNQPHRGDIGKMLVHSAWRRRGIGRRLLAFAEAAALEDGRTLLMLDTQSGSAGEALYRECGWIEYGRVPGHALDTFGVPADTTFFFKQLS